MKRIDSQAALERLVREAGLPPPPPDAFARLTPLLALRAAWGKTHNLSGPRTARDPWSTDVIDALALLAGLAPSLPLVDVGAGGGVPGLLLAALLPEHPITLVETAAKRVAFLRTAAQRLGLTRAHICRGTWPTPLTTDVQVVGRAVVNLERWPVLALAGGPHVQVFFRMLAARQPEVTARGFALALALAYHAPGSSPRRLERWARCPRAAP